MKTRTFQEIYDFCRTDLTYQAYFHIPDEFSVKDRKTARYYFGRVQRRKESQGDLHLYTVDAAA